MKKSNAAALARYAAQLTGGGREMINILVTIARDVSNTPSERRAAAETVLERIAGKAPATVEVDVAVTHTANVGALSGAELADLRAKLLKMTGRETAALPAPRPAVIDVGEQEDGEPEETWEDEP